MDRVTQALDACRRHGVFLEMVTERVMKALVDAGIRCTALKGAILSRALYGDPGRRLSSDIDILVAREQLQEAVGVVRELGYMAPSDHIDEFGLPLLHFALSHEHGQLPNVELHWRIHWYEQSFASERLLPPEGEFTGRWRPAPIDGLAALLLFYARDGFAGLRLATDVGACWDAFETKRYVGALDDPVRAYPELKYVLFAAAKAAEKTVGLPLERLTERRVRLGGRQRLAVLLASPHPRVSRTQLHADMGLVDGLLAPPGGFRAFVRRQVILPREILYEHAQKSQRPRARSSLGHGVRILARYALAIAELVRSPSSR